MVDICSVTGIKGYLQSAELKYEISLANYTFSQEALFAIMIIGALQELVLQGLQSSWEFTLE